MTAAAFEAFENFRNDMKKLCSSYSSLTDELKQLQSDSRGDIRYELENPVVYNTSYDSITQDDSIRLIVVGDNPGKEEQLDINRRYLCGQSGRIAEGFFRRNGELGIDFRKNTVISNKTPIHTAKTKHIAYLMKNGSESVKEALIQSQIRTAELTARLHKNLCANGENCSLWLVGYSELKEKGLFLNYRDTLKNCYTGCGESGNRMSLYWDKVYVYQHFSMNRFLIDLKSFQKEEVSLQKSLEELGHKHRDEIFCM